MVECKVCKIKKQKIYSHYYKKGCVYIDEKGKRWSGKVCPKCFVDNQREKSRLKFGSNRLKVINCVECNTEFKQSTANHKFCGKQCFQTHSWKINKDKLKQISLIHRIKKAKIKQCKYCVKDFKTIISKRILYCSKECSDKSIKEYLRIYQRKYYNYTGLRKTREILSIACRQCKVIINTKSKTRKFCSKDCVTKFYSKPPKSPIIIICPNCDVQFKTYTKAKKFCKSKCQERFARQKYKVKRKQYDKIRELKKKRRVPVWANLKKIEEIYKNVPDNMQVDHIIPLNGKNVCGFHVEYNLQYLTSKENNIKTNQCDGTYENNSWKIFQSTV